MNMPTRKEIDDWHEECAVDACRPESSIGFWPFEVSCDNLAEIVVAALSRWGGLATSLTPEPATAGQDAAEEAPTGQEPLPQRLASPVCSGVVVVESRRRRFVSVSRTMTSASTIQSIDAICEEGRAWWLTIGSYNDHEDWSELRPLPSIEVAERPTAELSPAAEVINNLVQRMGDGSLTAKEAPEEFLNRYYSSPPPADRLALAVCRARQPLGGMECRVICQPCRRDSAAVTHELATILRERYGFSTTADWLDGVTHPSSKTNG